MDPIIIIGSGLCGLAFAQGLHKSSIPFHIHERGPSSNIRKQGYRIRIHNEGIDALLSVLTGEIWDLFDETCAATVLGPLPFINAFSCKHIPVQFGGNNPQSKLIQEKRKPYTVDRGILREILLTGLDQKITYEKVYTHYTLTDSGITAHFADGTSSAGSLLVGADGAHSAVRRQYLPHLRILDTKSRPIYGKTPLTPSFESLFLPKAMECMSMIKDLEKKTTTLIDVVRFLPNDQRKDQRDLPSNYVYWVIIPEPNSFLVTEEQLNNTNMKGITEKAHAYTANWHPSLRSLIEEQDPNHTVVFRVLTADPELLKLVWEPNARVTIFGDAAHAMVPSTASGAVTALRDAALLSSLIREQGIVKDSIGKYEEEMRKYGSEEVGLSAKVGRLHIGLGPMAEFDVLYGA